MPVSGNDGSELEIDDDDDDEDDDEDDDAVDAIADDGNAADLPFLLVSETIGRECNAAGRCGDCSVESSNPRLDSGSDAYLSAC